jgi:hypothetical protein
MSEKIAELKRQRRAREAGEVLKDLELYVVQYWVYMRQVHPKKAPFAGKEVFVRRTMKNLFTLPHINGDEHDLPPLGMARKAARKA